MATTIEYLPGVCNIGPAEIRQRMMIGYIGSAVTVVLFLILYFLHLPSLSRVVLVLPAFMAATGFIQGLTHFCAGYGMEGMFNFTDQRSKAQKTPNPVAIAKDRQKALTLFGYSAFIAIVVTAILYLI